MPRSLFGLASLWGGLTVLTFCGSASAQWFPGSGGNCGCSSAPTLMGPPPIIHQSAAAFGAAPMMPVSYAANDMVQCGPPVACHIEQPMQVVHVQAVAPVAQVVAVQQLQPVVQHVMQHVQVTEMQPVKRTVQKPVVTTEYVDQLVTEMRPVSELKTVNVPTVDYQTVTEYRTVKRDVGYWATKNVATARVNPWQYDNRPNVAGAMNRASYNMRNAFTPQYQQVRQYMPQTMTCQVPYCKKVAVPGMKQVTYNVSRMQPTQTTRKVAVNKVSYQTAEVTVMAPVQVVKTVHVGSRVSYAPAGTTATALGITPANGGNTALAPTPDANSKAAPRAADSNKELDPDKINDKRRSSLETYDALGNRISEAAPAHLNPSASQPAKTFSAPSVVRVSQWVARTSSSSPSNPQPSGKSTAISIADSAR